MCDVFAASEEGWRITFAKLRPSIFSGSGKPARSHSVGYRSTVSIIAVVARSASPAGGPRR